MDRSSARLPDSVPDSSNRERRRWIRQKLYTPVYASFNGPQTGMVVDLSELLDLHEEGFAVQTGERLEVKRAVTLCLDLPETQSFIHGCGEVVWSDDSGRGGIRFSALSESSKQILREWLFSNLLIGCANHAARIEQTSEQRSEQHSANNEKSPGPVLVPTMSAYSGSSEKLPNIISISSRSNTAANHVEAETPPAHGQPEAIPVENAVPENLDLETPDLKTPELEYSKISWQTERRYFDSDSIGIHADALFQLITERAVALTGASAAALAFLTGGKMICRARSGKSAPPLAAPIDIERGLSGECVRTGTVVSCEDLGNDSRLDPEIGRALGIGSLMALPIVSNFRVAGLLEVFSPHPHTFTKAHSAALQELLEMIPDGSSVKPEHVPAATSRPQVSNAVHTPPLEKQFAADPVDRPRPERIDERITNSVPQPPPKKSSGTSELILPSAVVAVVALALGYLLSPAIERRLSGAPQQEVQEVNDAAPAIPWQSVTERSAAAHRSANQPGFAKSIADLRKLADQGDADAQWQMGIRYHDGEGVPEDDSRAVEWFQRAADQGNVASQGALGAYYWKGRGVTPDLSKAYFWSAIAMAGGDDISKSRLEGLASQMTRDQVSSSRQLAEEWIHNHTQQRAKSEAN